MKVIVAGGRDYNDYNELCKVCDYMLQNQTNIEIVSGKAPGADTLGETYGKASGYPIRPFPADWNDFTEPCLIKHRRDGTKYNALAGHKRNRKMAAYADVLIAFWDGDSNGTLNMINQAKAHGLKVKIHRYKKRIKNGENSSK